jgi:heat-inducible transcriptional repressor
MEPRLARLLQVVVEEYIETTEPVGSQHLVDRYDLEVSSATVRNWCAELESSGHLMQPHTSGGRIPTEEGFRTYVSLFVSPKSAAKRDRDVLERAWQGDDEERRFKALAKALSELSGQAAIVGLGEADTFYTGLSQLFSQPEFRNWQQVVSLTEVLDRLDEALNAMRATDIREPRILLGQECPFGPACATIVCATKQGCVGVLGPMRMEYGLIANLVQSTYQLISTS